MAIADARARRLMDYLLETSLSWREAADDYDLAPELLRVINDVAPVIGDDRVVFAIGLIMHEVTGDLDGFDIRVSEDPNVYDLTVFTDDLIVTAWGALREGGHEPVSVVARKSISRVTVKVSPGDVREDGTKATHHELTLTMADGSAVEVPGIEGDFTAAGNSGLAALVPSLYVDVAR